MAIQSPWKYYYAAKEALQYVEAYFVFSNNDDEVAMDFDKVYEGLKHIGTVLAETSKDVR